MNLRWWNEMDTEFEAKIRYEECPECKGEGCKFCSYTGKVFSFYLIPKTSYEYLMVIG